MWWKKTPPDALLGAVSSGVLAAIGQLRVELDAVSHRLTVSHEHLATGRALEQRLATVEARAKALASLLDDHVSRIDAALTQMRHSVAGQAGGRGRGRDRDAEQVGQQFLSALQDPQALAQLVEQLQAHASQTSSELPLFPSARPNGISR